MSRTKHTPKLKKNDREKKDRKKKDRKKDKDKQEQSSVKSLSVLPITKTEDGTDALQQSGLTKKPQCDLCKLSYSTQKELEEHLLSLLHHTKLEEKEKDPVHICTLCNTTCFDMVVYRTHINTDVHQRNLMQFKKSPAGDKEKDEKRVGLKGVNNEDHSGSTSGMSATNSFSKQSHSSQYLNSHFNSNNKHPGSHFILDSQGNGNPAYMGWKNKKSSHRGRPHYGNKSQVWATRRPGNKFNMLSGMNNGGKGVPQIPKNKQFYNPLGSSGSGNNYNYYGGFQNSYSDDYRQEDHSHSQEDYHWQEYPDDNDDASYNTQGPWDDKLLLQHERFLASMEDFHLSCSNRSQFSQETTLNERWKYSSTQNRKRPRNKDTVQEFTHSNFFSDFSVPMRESYRRDTTFYVNVETLNKLNSAQESINHCKDHHQSLSDDNCLIERAKRLCKEHTEKQGMAQSQFNYLEKDSEILGADALKQKTFQKGSSKPSENREKYNMSSTSVFSKKSTISDLPDNVNTETLLSTIQHNSAGNTLDEIMKSIENSVLECQGGSEKQFKCSIVPEPKRRRSSSICSGPAISEESRNITINKPSTTVSQKKLVLKDSIKKIVNTPHSREGRLTLAKILKSRDEHKITNLRRTTPTQSLNDPVVVSQEISVDVNECGGVETIELDDFSDNDCHQILNCIGENVSDRFGIDKEPETARRTLNTKKVKKARDPQPEVIVLSDTEDLSEKCDDNRKSTKKRSKKISSVSEPVDSSEVIKVEKKKKKKIQTTSDCTLNESVLSSVEDIICSVAKVPEEVKDLRRTEVFKVEKKKNKIPANSNCTLNESILTSIEDTISSVAKVPEEINELTRTEVLIVKKKKKKIPTNSNCTINESVLASVEDVITSVAKVPKDINELTRTDKECTNEQEKAMCQDNEAEFILCSFKEAFDKNKEVYSTEATIFESSKQECVSSGTFSSSPASSNQILSCEDIKPSVLLLVNSSSQTNRTEELSSHLLDIVSSGEAGELSSHSLGTVSSGKVGEELSFHPLGTVSPGDELSPCDNLSVIETANDVVAATEIRLSNQCQLNSEKPYHTSCGMSNHLSADVIQSSLPHMEPPVEPNDQTLFGMSNKSNMDGIYQSSSPHMKPPEISSSSLQSELSSPSVLRGPEASSPDIEPTSPFLPYRNTSFSACQSSRLTLPPSTWLIDRTCSSPNNENQSTPTTEAPLPSLQSLSDKGIKVEEGIVVLEGGESTVKDSPEFPDTRTSNIASSDTRNDFTSRIMSELLVLSEREEQVKQEKKSLDLRLSRLHKVLEHALKQINKFTEQRKQLHEEEQELSGQRFSLIKAIVPTPEAVSLDKNFKSAAMLDKIPATFTSGDSTHDTIPSSKSSKSLVGNEKCLPSTESMLCPVQGLTEPVMFPLTIASSHISSVISSIGDNTQGSTLSKADWLAKFSSYLPQDPSD